MRRLEMLGVSCFVCACLASFAAPTQAQRYRLTDLGVIPGQDPPHDESFAYGMNNRGQIVGQSYRLTRPAGARGFIWENGTWTIVPPLTSGTSQGNAINENGVVAGQASSHAYLWIDGKPMDIHGIQGFNTGSAAFDVNDNVVACGMFWYFAFGPSFPFMWRDGVWTQLRVPPPGGPFDHALAVNNHDDIVGVGAAWPILWPAPDYQPLILETLPIDFGWAYDIHDNGTIVGFLNDNAEQGLGALWEGTRLVRLLPRPHPDYDSVAYATNAYRKITVGARIFVGGGGYHNFIWREGVMMDLQDLVGLDFEKDYFNIRWAYDINDHGQIAATAAKRINGEERGRAVLLDPLDEGFAVWSITPCNAGVENTIEVVNATPGGMVHLVFGLMREGAIPVPGCPEAIVEIRNPRLIGRARADAEGRAEFRAFVPEQVARRTFVLQAIDRASCEVSPPAWTLFMDR